MIRVLRPGDERAVEGFLRPLRETSMFLRSNLRRAGIEDRGERYQGCYVGVFDGDLLTGIVCHGWQGNVVLQLPGHQARAAELAIRTSGRPIAGVVGPWDQVEWFRGAFALEEQPTTLDSREPLFALDLSTLTIPAPLRDGRSEVRRPRADERDTLVEWTFDYAVEALKQVPTPALRATAEESVDAELSAGTRYLLLDQGTPVAMTGFNATLPDCVQVGGVYTPPEFRARGYGRCAVAGSLGAVHATGVAHAFLFTDEGNTPAQRAYAALGFERIGDYGLVRFAQPAPLPE